jgi:hypothetical protein
MTGKHKRRTDHQEPEFGQAGTPEQVKRFDDNVSRHKVETADKRLAGRAPYDAEPGSKPPVDPETGERKP